MFNSNIQNLMSCVVGETGQSIRVYHSFFGLVSEFLVTGRAAHLRQSRGKKPTSHVLPSPDCPFPKCAPLAWLHLLKMFCPFDTSSLTLWVCRCPDSYQFKVSPSAHFLQSLCQTEDWNSTLDSARTICRGHIWKDLHHGPSSYTLMYSIYRLQ